MSGVLRCECGVGGAAAERSREVNCSGATGKDTYKHSEEKVILHSDVIAGTQRHTRHDGVQ